MSDTVGRYLDGQGGGTAEKAAENVQLANLFMGLLGRMIVEAQQRGKPLEAIAIGRPEVVNGTTIAARVEWRSIIPASSAGAEFISSRYSDVGDFIAAKAAGLSRACARNPQFVRFLNSFFGVVENLCRHKGWKFEDVRVTRAILSKEDSLVITLECGPVAHA